MAVSGVGRRYAVIMAGGWGERLWPLATPTRPKPTLRLTGLSTSPLQHVIDSASRVVGDGRVFVATSETMREVIQAACADMPVESFIVEPLRRDTAGCVAFALATLLTRGVPMDSVVGFYAADCIATDTASLCRALDAAYRAAEEADELVCLGIRPTRPDTSLGYLELETEQGWAQPAGAAVPVRRFIEKPPLDVAQEFAGSGRHLWNSGTVIGRCRTFVSAMETAAPDLAAVTHGLREALASDPPGDTAGIMSRLRPQSIDYALLEKARLLAVVAETPWDTLSDWGSIQRILGSDEHGNATTEKATVTDTRDTVVYVEASVPQQDIVVHGVQGLVVVATKDAILVMPRDRAAEVRHAVEALRAHPSRAVPGQGGEHRDAR